MNHYCVICTYTTPDGRELKAVTNDVPAASSGDAVFNVMDSLTEKGAMYVKVTKVTQTD